MLNPRNETTQRTELVYLGYSTPSTKNGSQDIVPQRSNLYLGHNASEEERHAQDALQNCNYFWGR